MAETVNNDVSAEHTMDRNGLRNKKTTVMTPSRLAMFIASIHILVQAGIICSKQLEMLGLALNLNL